MASQSDKITFDRKKFAPLLDKLGKDANLEDLFLEFLRKPYPVSAPQSPKKDSTELSLGFAVPF